MPLTKIGSAPSMRVLIQGRNIFGLPAGDIIPHGTQTTLVAPEHLSSRIWCRPLFGASPVSSPPAIGLSNRRQPCERMPRVTCGPDMGCAPGSRRIGQASRWKSLLLLFAFRMRRLGMLACILCVLLSLGRVLFALGVVILTVRLGSGAMGLRRRLVMFRRLVVASFILISLVGR
jgi:hypothetical protein